MDWPIGPILKFCLWAALSGMLLGCTHASAHRLELGAQARTSSFTDEPGALPLNTNDVIRSRWDTTVFLVPIDGIVHHPTFRVQRVPLKKDAPRVYGLLPTALSSLEFQRSGGLGSVMETIDELGSSIFALIDPFFVASEMMSTQWSPVRVWKRTRQEDAWSSGRPGTQTGTQTGTQKGSR